MVGLQQQPVCPQASHNFSFDSALPFAECSATVHVSAYIGPTRRTRMTSVAQDEVPANATKAEAAGPSSSECKNSANGAKLAA